MRRRRGGWPSRRPGLRRTVTLAFAAGGLVLSTVLALGTYLVARDYLVGQREQTAVRQSFADAGYVRDGLLTAGQDVDDVLGEVAPATGTTVLVRRGNDWYSSSLTASSDTVPTAVVDRVAGGSAAVVWTQVDGDAAVVVGVAVPAAGVEFYEVARTTELNRTLDALAVTLSGFALLTTAAGAALGRWSARRLLAPLDVVAAASAGIAGGDLTTRLPSTDDPELVTIIGSFNAMVDALAERVERDARFTADVSHELRSPLTTLTTAVQLMERRRGDLPPSGQQALDLLSDELRRFRSVVEDLLELGRLDSGVAAVRTPVVVGELVDEALRTSGRDLSAVELSAGAAADVVEVDKQQLARALVNLFDNADLHGGGLVRVALRRSPSHVEVLVDDAGSGVSEADRQRVFERFVRGGSRGSRPGTGLGLSLVAETLRAHGGSVRYVDRAGGGARFVVRLPHAARAGGDHAVPVRTAERTRHDAPV